MKNYISLLMLVLLSSCVEDFNHKEIDTTILDVDLSSKKEITFKQLYNLHGKEIGKDTVVTGYVVSSDHQGNFYKEIFIQNTLGTDDLGEDNPRMGIKIRIGLNPTNTKYTLGRKIVVHLKGLKKIRTDDYITLGQPNNTFIKDISEFELNHYISKIDEVGQIIPKTTTLSDLTKNDLNTLVEIQDLHFQKSQVGLPFSGLSTDDFDGKRILEYCSDFRDSIILETSNFADFASNIIPNSQIDITALYSISFNDEPILVINEFKDITETIPYVDCVIHTSNILITEVADPQEDTKARFVEIYNPTDKDMSLKGWSLVRYNFTSSKNTRELAALPISLDGLMIDAKGFLIVARDEAVFNNYFGINAFYSSSKLDGNGDDAYELIDSFGAIVDVYGDSGVDGSDSEWEYTDGFAKRRSTIDSANNEFDLSEWEVMKDQNLSSDFNPKVR